MSNVDMDNPCVLSLSPKWKTVSSPNAFLDGIRFVERVCGLVATREAHSELFEAFRLPALIVAVGSAGKSWEKRKNVDGHS